MNRPGLDRIDYRIGTYPSFLASMVEQVATDERLAAWTARRDDYGIALLQLWAYIGDVLTFYQERIVNEAFLRTAVNRESVMRLARLIDYEPAPGIAAVVPMAFTVEAGKQVDVPIGLRVQSVPGQHDRPQKFETVEPLTALATLNELFPVLDRPARRGDRSAVFTGIATSVRSGEYIAFAGKEIEDNPASDRWDIRRVTDVAPGQEPRTTSLTWERPLGRVWPPAPTSGAPQAYRFREQAWPFGHDAPGMSPVVEWQLELLERLMKDALNPPGPVIRGAEAAETGTPETDTSAKDDPGTDRKNEPAVAPERTDFPQDPARPDYIFLDRVYPAVTPEGWVALVTHNATTRAPGRFYAELYRIREVAEVVRSGYGTTAPVTRLRVETVPQIRDGVGCDQPENIDFFPIQGTAVLIVSEPLGRAVVPDEQDVAGTRLRLDGRHPDLQVGRSLVVAGSPVVTGSPAAETCTVADVRLEEATTVVTLTAALAGSYIRRSVRVFGNVALATHGETVPSEVLGDGDVSTRFPSLAIKKHPVTHVPRTGAPHGAAASLVVRVDGIEYAEVPSLLSSGPTDRVYEHRVETDGSSTITFGDGEHGAVPPTGRRNITARYRTGLGVEGNVDALSIRNLLDRPTGLKSAGNPLPALGGSDPETLDAIRENAPNIVRTFGRVVSLSDFEDVAREITGIAKARAAVIEERGAQVAMVTVAGERGAPVVGDLYRRLVDELDARRDRNRRMVVRDHRPVHVTLGAAVVVDTVYPAVEVVRRCHEAVAEHLAFERQDFGRAVHLSDVYAVLQEVAGVVGVNLEWLDVVDPEDPEAAPVLRQSLPVAAHELATLRDRGDVVIHVQGVPR